MLFLIFLFYISVKYFFLCVSSIALCPEGWVRWNGYCWYISKDDRLTFEAAEAACSQVNSRARLASIHDEFDNRFLAGKLYSGFHRFLV